MTIIYCQTFSNIKILDDKQSGADRKFLLYLCNLTVCLRLNYGRPIYSSVCNNFLTILNSVHHFDIHIITGAFPISSSLSLSAEFNQSTPSVHRDYLTLRTTTSCLVLFTSPLNFLSFDPSISIFSIT